MSFFEKLFRGIGSKHEAPAEIPTPVSDQEPLETDPVSTATKLPAINWTDPKAKIGKYFTVHEALWLPSWGVYHIPSESEKEEILKTAAVMDKIREYLNVVINVHCWIRPILNQPGHPRHGQDYNAFVKGAAKSAHKTGEAVDWSSPGIKCDVLRQKLLLKLDEFDICMEDLPGSNWVHIDRKPPRGGKNRFFKP